MARKKLIRVDNLPYHLTARANNREEFPAQLSYVWKILAQELYLQQILYEVRVHAFVLMPNHFHLLATSSNRGIDLVMKEVLGSATRILNTSQRRSGHVFGGRYFWSLIRQPDYYAHAMKYVIRNPVRAGLCSFVGEHPFSTYSGLVGEIHLPLAITPPPQDLARLIPIEALALDQWLNQAHSAEQNAAIRKAFRRKEFEFSSKRESRRKPEFAI